MVSVGRRLLAATLALGLAPGLAGASPAGWSPLLAPDELAVILASTPEVRVVQVSGDFAAGHIPDAVRADYAEWRGPVGNPGQLPETAALQALVQRLGITAETPVAIVHGGSDPTDMGAATRVYWTLKSLGVVDLAVVNGGMAAWAAAGLPTSRETAAVTPSDYAPELSDAWRVTTAEVQRLVDAGSGAHMVDARPSGFFEGRLWSVARPGTIRGADSFPFERWFDGNAMVDPERARQIAIENGLTDAPLTVSFCNTGHWASINWFALHELAGVANTRLYAESMAEWSAAGGALDNVPGRVRYYYLVTRNWLGTVF